MPTRQRPGPRAAAQVRTVAASVSYGTSMLEGRDDELARLGELLAELQDGRGRALLIRGEPGIGKTALLAELVRRCGADVTVLRASGVQTEAELPFAALSGLLAPVLDGLVELPAPQADAMGAALALGPPSPGDRLAVCVATLGLLQIAARTRPVLVVVDDVQITDTTFRAGATTNIELPASPSRTIDSPAA